MNRRRRERRGVRSALVALALGVAALPHAALADDAAPDGGAQESSESCIQRGIALRREGSNREALDAFEQAFALRPSPRARAQVALAHQALGDWVEAESGLTEALRSDDAWIARYHDTLDQALAKVRTHLGWLDLEANVPGAALFVDGARAAAWRSSEPIRLGEGPHDVTLRAPGYAPVDGRVEIATGAHAHAALTLTPLPVAAGKPTAFTAADRENLPADLSKPAPGRTFAVAMLSVAGALTGAGIAAWRVRETNAATYNDDQRCLVGSLTRDQRCGANARAAGIAEVVEIGAFAAAGVSAAVGVWRLEAAASRPRTPATQAARAVCGAGAFWGGVRVACEGSF
jgi:hypothetical protein